MSNHFILELVRGNRTNYRKVYCCRRTATAERNGSKALIRRGDEVRIPSSYSPIILQGGAHDLPFLRLEAA